MTQKPFGKIDTNTKLTTVFGYANFYTKVLRNNNFHLCYVDAFAGTGEIPYSNDMPLFSGKFEFDNFIEGSARRALKIDIPFDRYIFADNVKRNVEELTNLKQDFPHLAGRISIQKNDANEVIQDFCTHMRPMDRALVFLDPFGNQVSWETLRILANTRRVDLWYLFPAWIGVARQVSNSGKLQPDAEKSIDKMMGPCDWRSECIKFIEPDQPTLFERGPEATKIATADGITRLMISQMRTIFGGGVSDKWLPLGRNGQHWYSLLFACANPGNRAKSLAQRVAREIMTRK